MSSRLQALRESMLRSQALSLSRTLTEVLTSPRGTGIYGSKGTTLSTVPLGLSSNSSLAFLSKEALETYSSRSVTKVFKTLSEPLPALKIVSSGNGYLVHRNFCPGAKGKCALSSILRGGMPRICFLSVHQIRKLLHSVVVRPLFILSRRWQKSATGDQVQRIAY